MGLSLPRSQLGGEGRVGESNSGYLEGGTLFMAPPPPRAHTQVS